MNELFQWTVTIGISVVTGSLTYYFIDAVYSLRKIATSVEQCTAEGRLKRAMQILRDCRDESGEEE